MKFKRSALLTVLSVACGGAFAQAGESGSLFAPVKDDAGKATGESTYSPSVNTTLPGLEGDGIQLEGIRLFVSPRLRVGYDDNVANAPNTPSAPARKATTTILTAPITGVIKSGTSETRLGASLSSTTFGGGNSNENQNNNRFSIDHVNALGARTDVRAGVFFLDANDPRGQVENQGIEPNRSNTTGISLGGGYGAAGAQGRFEIDTRFTDQKYKNNFAVTTFLDRKTSDLAGRFLYRIAPKTRAVFEVQRINVNFRNDTNGGDTTVFRSQDQSDTRASVGMRWDATAKTSGGFRIGRSRKEFKETTAERPNTTAGFYDASISWSPLSYSTVSLSAGQNFSDSFRTAGTQINRRRSVSWSHSWLERFSTVVSYSRTLDDYDNFRLTAITGQSPSVVERADRLDTVSLAANYKYSPTVTVGLEVRMSDRESNIGPGFALPGGGSNPGDLIGNNFNYNKNVALFTIGAVF